MASVPSGSNSMAWFGRGPDHQQAELLGRHHLGDLVRGGAPSLAAAHLPPADVQELVREVERRLAVKDLARDGVRSVP